jgi:hypothetical protein
LILLYNLAESLMRLRNTLEKRSVIITDMDVIFIMVRLNGRKPVDLQERDEVLVAILLLFQLGFIALMV